MSSVFKCLILINIIIYKGKLNNLENWKKTIEPEQLLLKQMVEYIPKMDIFNNNDRNIYGFEYILINVLLCVK